MTMGRFFLLWIFWFVCGVWFGPASAFEQTGSYDRLNINGWTVYVSSELQAKPKTRRTILQKIQNQTAQISKGLSAKHLRILRKADIWVEDGRHYRALARYHGSKTGIFQENLNPKKFRDVEVFGNFATLRAPTLMLHELAHVYHDRKLNWSSRKIERLFDRFKAGAPKAKDRCGPPSRAYALTNPQEFFATFTEAYFAKTCFFPYNRDTIQKNFPEMDTLLREVWGG